MYKPGLGGGGLMICGGGPPWGGIGGAPLVGGGGGPVNKITFEMQQWKTFLTLVSCEKIYETWNWSFDYCIIVLNEWVKSYSEWINVKKLWMLKINGKQNEGLLQE